MLSEDHRDRTSRRRVAAMQAGIVLAEPLLKALSGSANVISAISAAQNVKVSTIIHLLHLTAYLSDWKGRCVGNSNVPTLLESLAGTQA
jgi:hypothetical protein